MTPESHATGQSPREKLREDAVNRTTGRAVYHLFDLRQRHLTEDYE